MYRSVAAIFPNVYPEFLPLVNLKKQGEQFFLGQLRYLEKMQTGVALPIVSAAKTRSGHSPETGYVFSVTHKKNFGKPFVAHIGSRDRGGINFFPICGWRASGAVTVLKSPPPAKKICPKCATRYRKKYGEEPPQKFPS
jgi:hypothetical protein